MMIVAGEIRAADVVSDELGQRDDEVKQWAGRQQNLFAPLDADIQRATRETSDQHPKWRTCA